jgi:hypothetical protein
MALADPPPPAHSYHLWVADQTACYERRNWVCGVRNERRRRSTELLRALRTEGVATAESEG